MIIKHNLNLLIKYFNVCNQNLKMHFLHLSYFFFNFFTKSQLNQQVLKLFDFT